MSVRKNYQIWKTKNSSIDRKEDSEPYLYSECKTKKELAIRLRVSDNRLKTILSYGFGMWFRVPELYESYCVKYK